MDNHWSSEAGLERLLLPSVLLLIVLIWFEFLRAQNLLGVFTLVGSVCGLLFSGRLALILQVEPDWLLEVALDRAALILALESVKHLNIDFGSVESTISMVEGPRLAIAVERGFEL